MQFINRKVNVIKSRIYRRYRRAGFVSGKFASWYLRVVRNKLAFIVWHDRSGIDTRTCSALEIFQSSVTVDFLRQRFALTRILLLFPASLSGELSSRRRLRRRCRSPYLYLSIFFSLYSRHVYVCTEYKGAKKEEKRLYRELRRLARRERRRREKILNIAFGRAWLSAKWLRWIAATLAVAIKLYECVSLPHLHLITCNAMRGNVHNSPLSFANSLCKRDKKFPGKLSRSDFPWRHCSRDLR